MRIYNCESLDVFMKLQDLISEKNVNVVHQEKPRGLRLSFILNLATKQ